MAPILVEVSDSPEGLVELKVRDSNGVRIGFFQVSEDDLDDELVADIKAWQIRHAHRALFIVSPSGSVSAG